MVSVPWLSTYGSPPCSFAPTAGTPALRANARADNARRTPRGTMRRSVAQPAAAILAALARSSFREAFRRVAAAETTRERTVSSYDRMSAHDAGYLTRETAAQPLHYVVQLDVEGRLDFDDVRDDVARRLDALPIAHRRARYPLLAGRP